MLGKRLRKYTMAGSLVTPHFRAYLASAILTKVMSRLSVSLSMFSSFSMTAMLSGVPASSIRTIVIRIIIYNFKHDF